MHRHHDSTIGRRMKQNQMTASLTIFDKSLALEEANQFFGGDGRQAWTHLGNLDEHLGDSRTLLRDCLSTRFQRLDIEIDRLANVPLGFRVRLPVAMTTGQRRHPGVKPLWPIGFDDHRVGTQLHFAFSLPASGGAVNPRFSRDCYFGEAARCRLCSPPSIPRRA
jgi:hypothetical protein